MAAPTVVFDLDGTLVDTAPDLVSTLNAVFERAGLAPVACDAARNMIGAGARTMIERGLNAQQTLLPSAEVDRLAAAFIEHYAAHIADRSRPFPGAEPMLDELRRRGCRIAICTNKLEWLSLKLLDALGLTRRFAAVCGGDTFGVAKPDPAILLGTLARAGGLASRAVMVGDAITDIAVARAAAIPVIAVTFGYSETPVALLKPDRIVTRFDQLPDLVFALADAKTQIAPKS